jgi:hypothetical protein
MMNISFPFHFDAAGRTASVSDDDHIRDLIEQLLFQPNSDELAATLQFTLQGALQQTLGDRIQLQGLQVTNADSTLQVVVQYLVKGHQQPQFARFTQEVS